MEENNKKKVRLDGQDVYISYAVIGDIPYAVKIKADIGKQKKFLQYKTHKIYEADIEFTEIKKDKPLFPGVSREESEMPSQKVYPEISISDLVKVVKAKSEAIKGDKLHIKMDANNIPVSSKVIDENGEPLVVYHGGTFAVNDDNNIASSGMHFGTKKAALDRIFADKLIQQETDKVKVMELKKSEGILPNKIEKSVSASSDFDTLNISKIAEKINSCSKTV